MGKIEKHVPRAYSLQLFINIIIIIMGSVIPTFFYLKYFRRFYYLAKEPYLYGGIESLPL